MAARAVSVFCGAGGKISDELKQMAFKLGYELAKQGYTLVSGGASVGMMKEVVDGHIHFDLAVPRHGVMPTIFREYNVHHTGITTEQMIWTDDVYIRLKTFYDLSDDIVVLPGGLGTLHEFIDCLVHVQLGMITKSIFLLNINNFWDPILEQFKIMVQEKAVQQKHIDNLIVADSVEDLLAKMAANTGDHIVQGLESNRWETE